MNNYRTPFPQTTEAQRGAPLIEFAIIIPFLAIILMFTFESGRLLYNYLIVSHLAAEGTRFAAQLNPLPQVCFETAPNRDDGSQPTDLFVAHWLTHRQVRILLNAYGGRLNTVRVSDPTKPGGDIDTQFISATNPIAPCHVAGEEVDVISVRIRFRYIPIIFTFLDVPISVEITGPYLVNNEQFPINTGNVVPSSGFSGSSTWAGSSTYSF